jgi:hypothetical protein
LQIRDKEVEPFLTTDCKSAGTPNGQQPLENIVGRRNASPPGDKRKRKPARRSCGFEIRRPKRLDHFNADLQSASSENAKRGYEKPTAADCKSAIKRSSLF